MAKHYGTPCGTVHELENSEQPKCRQRDKQIGLPSPWQLAPCIVTSYVFKDVQGRGTYFHCFNFNLLHFYVHLCLTGITQGSMHQPVATPTAGGMAGMGSGSKFLEAKLGLEATWSKRRYSNFLCPVTPSVFETTA